MSFASKLSITVIEPNEMFYLFAVIKFRTDTLITWTSSHTRIC